MAITRPVKTFGTRAYASEVGAAPNNEAPILSNEVDADLDLLYAQVNTGPIGAAGGDLIGTYPNPTIGAGKITNAKLAEDAPGQFAILYDTITVGANSTAAFQLVPMHTTVTLLMNRMYRLTFGGGYRVAGGALGFQVWVGTVQLASTTMALNDVGSYFFELLFTVAGGINAFGNTRLDISRTAAGGIIMNVGESRTAQSIVGDANLQGPLINVFFTVAHANNFITRLPAVLELL